MAPVDRVDHNVLEQELKDVIQDLYQIMVQIATYDSVGRPSKEVLSNEMYESPHTLSPLGDRPTLSSKTLSQSLQKVHISASPPNNLPSVPPELLEYVEHGRNPDIYTREFVELVRRGNQLMRGKRHAFETFRDTLAENMTTAMPELREDVAQVVEATGGVPPGKKTE
ncbi:hypothetical protein CEP52_009558 [Fusarium oligoseptatum]|uniref:Mediator of RNA polymerase II transcription subunit 10 n=1 Tax=Fusarium oligoseptatum TaxID=2604345 RepID=A0A428TCI3_9HYPO|nr:hypothetical protein CEP52_009558 [Fusarium oligoseptatum]